MMRNMHKWATAALAVAILGACGDSSATQPSGPLAAAASDAADAVERIDALEARVGELEDELANQTNKDDSFKTRLAALSGRLDKATERLWQALRGLRSDLNASDAEVSDALGQIGSIAREIAVLDQRLNYHLRNHGGG